MTDFLWNLGSFVVGLGILVTVHEFGHFWVAKKCGVIVERFSIGFGPALWQRTGKDGTVYAIALIPLGGYVKMLDERVEEVPEKLRARSFNAQSVGKRAAIVAAGPVFNFIFALFAYWIIFVIGMPTVKPVIGEIAPHSIASQADLEPRMIITQVDNINTSNWNDVNMAFASHIGEDSLTLTLQSNQGDFSVQKTLDLSQWHFDPETQSPIQTLGITPYLPQVLLQISAIMEDSPAQRAQLQVGDKLKTLNGEPIQDWNSFSQGIQQHLGQPLSLGIERNAEFTQLDIMPDIREVNGEKRGFLGIYPQAQPWPQEYISDLQFNPITAFIKSGEKTWELIVLTLNMTKKLLTGDIGVNNLSGPLSIAKGAGVTASYGVVSFLSFLALISVNLGLINLFPLPVLDGGHLLFFMVEAIIRRPIPEKVQEFSYRLGATLLFVLMGVAIFNDFTRL